MMICDDLWKQGTTDGHWCQPISQIKPRKRNKIIMWMTAERW